VIVLLADVTGVAVAYTSPDPLAWLAAWAQPAMLFSAAGVGCGLQLMRTVEPADTAG
jgi:hypothetical protein